MKDFAANRVRLNGIQLIQDTVDPTAGAGVPAEVGSQYFRGPGTSGVSTKTAAADTAWTLQSADIYFNVANYGATGDGVTDDRAAIQAAYDDAAVLGGTVFFPYGTYRCALNGVTTAVFTIDSPNIRSLGSGHGTTILIAGNCAGVARSLFRIESSSSIEFEAITFSQADLTNVVAQQCHLIDIGTDADITKIINCAFIDGIANAGAFVYAEGATGSEATNIWISACQMTDCGYASIWIDGGVQRVWIEDNVITQVGNGVDETILVLEGNGDPIDDVKIFGNEITNDTLYAIRVGATNGQLVNRLQIGDANIVSGFVSLGWINQGQISTNEVFATVSGVGDAVIAVEGQNRQLQIQSNIVGRASTCDAGRILTVTPGATTEVTSRLQVQNNRWIQETTFGIVHAIDIIDAQFLGNAMFVDDAGASAHSAYVFEADTDSVDNLLIADSISAEAGTWEFGVEYLAGVAFGVNSIVGGSMSAVATGVSWDSGGGGSFTSTQCMLSSNVMVATTAAWTSSSALFPRVGGNACAFGVNIIEGDGSPAGVVTARPGAIYLDRNGGAGATLFIKETGTGTAGWAAK